MDKEKSQQCCNKKQPHPLMLPPVLEVLFHICDFETLKLSRRVCKLWCNVSKTAFNKTCLINFYNMYPETYANLIESIEEGSTYTPVNVAMTLSPLYEDSISTRCLKVCPWHACEEFVLPFGESIESLKFYAWDSTTEKLNAVLLREIILTPRYLRNLEISLLPTQVSTEPLFHQPWEFHPPLSHLKSLTMYGRMECSDEFLLNFFSTMPNLKSIVVNCCSLDFLDIFTQSLYRIPLRKLEHLKLNFVGAFLDNHISNIRKAKVPLKTLHAAPRSFLTDFTRYNKLLCQLAPTLEDAKLTCCTNLETCEESVLMPAMSKLKTLRLQTWRSGPVCWNLGFINKTPCLETLIIEKRGLFIPSRSQFESSPEMFHVGKMQTHRNITSLVLPSEPFLLPNPNTLTTLLRKLPSLKSLTLSADDQCLRSIFKHSPLIERLTIAEYSKVSDHGITGLINESILPEGTEMRYDNYNIELGITTLTGLKRLEIDGFGGRITDFSIEYGIRHLEQLECLILQGCKITEHSKKLLPSVQLTVVDHDALHVYEQESF